MKRLYTILTAVVALASCSQKYELNTEFTVPTSLAGPEAVTLDVTSSETVKLSWDGGKAADGGIILYTVLFDKEGGNFSEPVAVKPSDLGAGSTLTLSHAELNTIARTAGIKTESTGKLIWTVNASRGGEVRPVNITKTLQVTRGEGIDNFPSQLYLKGSGSLGVGETEGREFRNSEEGIYVIYTKLTDGVIYFESDTETASKYYCKDGKLNEGNGTESVSASGIGEVERITVNFNTLNVKFEKISGVRAAFATGKFFDDMVLDNDVLSYVGGGVFFSSVGCDHFFHGWSWCEAADAGEERYTFYVDIDGRAEEWGVTDSKYGASRPKLTYGVEYFELKEYDHGRPDWGNNKSTFKFPSECEHACFDITIYTNKDNRWYHELSNFSEYVPGGAGSGITNKPSGDMTIKGAGAETDGALLVKVEDGVYRMPVTSFNGGPVYFLADGHSYYISGSKIKEGDNAAGVSATPAGTAERLTINFNDESVVRETISDLTLMMAAPNPHAIDNAVLKYQGNGLFRAAGARLDSFFYDWGWGEERYSFYLNIGENAYTWGRPDSGDAENRANVTDGTSETRPLAEFAGQGQWDHLWKFASAIESSTFDVEIQVNADGSMTHVFKNITPLIEGIQHIPSSLVMNGAGSEEEGLAFVKVSDGVFMLPATRIGSGNISFSGDGYTYYIKGGSLTEGSSSSAIDATADGVAERLTLNFNTREVTRNVISDVTLTWAADNPHSYEGGVLQYVGGGKFRASTYAEFYRGWDWCAANGEERYSFYLKIDDEEYTWGRDNDWDGEDRANVSGGQSDIRQLAESKGQGQWDHLWKAPTECDNQSFTVEIWFGEDGKMWHQFMDFQAR